MILKNHQLLVPQKYQDRLICHFNTFLGKLIFLKLFLYWESYNIVAFWVNILFYLSHFYMFSHRLHCLEQYITIEKKNSTHKAHYCQYNAVISKKRWKHQCMKSYKKTVIVSIYRCSSTSNSRSFFYQLSWNSWYTLYR